MPVEEAPDDEDVRQTYNFAPGNHGLVYRADLPDQGSMGSGQDDSTRDAQAQDEEAPEGHGPHESLGETRYKLQSMKWGLVPFWTKRNPDYGSVMKTINARDDALATRGGMWQTMKQKKRCIVIAQGFFEWLKKNGGKEKIPHFVKRRDEQLMCFAGLWDCVRYEGSDEKHYTYTIITTDSNKQLSFLHDRMPVILENGSEDIRTWLDPARTEWSNALQSLLKPFPGELECYSVSKEVGKVGNNSPNFIIPVASAENKSNIANFFSGVQKAHKKNDVVSKSEEEAEEKNLDLNIEIKQETGGAKDHKAGYNAPSPASVQASLKRRASHEPEDIEAKVTKTQPSASPTKAQAPPSKKLRSATSNGTSKRKTIKSDGSQKISNYFKP